MVGESWSYIEVDDNVNVPGGMYGVESVSGCGVGSVLNGMPFDNVRACSEYAVCEASTGAEYYILHVSTINT